MNLDKLEQTLKSLPPQTLRERYAGLYGHTPTTKNRAHLISKILWAKQREAFGDLSEASRIKAFAIADDRDVRGRFPQMQSPEHSSATRTRDLSPDLRLLPGSVLTRDYRGTQVRVHVLEDEFEWNGQTFRSLSATARAVTGTRWNGKLFFGLKKKGDQ